MVTPELVVSLAGKGVTVQMVDLEDQIAPPFKTLAVHLVGEVAQLSLLAAELADQLELHTIIHDIYRKR